MKIESVEKLDDLRWRRTGMRRGVALLPNLLTTGNLFCGFFSIVKTMQEQYVFAAWMVVFAGLFDFLDGRVARLTGTQSDFGVEYDSLSDLTTFCMAPAVLMFQWILNDYGKLGIFAGFLYFACGALRLARFNVQADTVEKSHFQGLPTPAAAGTMVSYVLFIHELYNGQPQWPHAVVGMTIFLALLMVSNVKYPSFKQMNKRASFFLFVCTVALLVLIAIRPEVHLFIFGICFVSGGIVHWLWTSPQRIRGLNDLVQKFFDEKATDED